MESASIALKKTDLGACSASPKAGEPRQAGAELGGTWIGAAWQARRNRHRLGPASIGELGIGMTGEARSVAVRWGETSRGPSMPWRGKVGSAEAWRGSASQARHEGLCLGRVRRAKARTGAITAWQAWRASNWWTKARLGTARSGKARQGGNEAYRDSERARLGEPGKEWQDKVRTVIA